MKVCSFFILFVLCSFTYGQTGYKSIPEDSATWIQVQFLYGGFHEHETVTTAVYLLGDTLINGQTYIRFGSHGMRKWIDGFGSPNQNSGGGSIPYEEGYFRQDQLQKKVFIRNTSNQSDELLYDFGSLVIGQPYPETITNLYYPNLLVMGQDSVQLMDGNYYKRWVLGTNSLDSAYTAVIEGVGGTHGFNTPIHPVFEQESHLLCHKVGTQHIYEDWQTSVISPEYSEDCSRTLSFEEKAEGSVLIYPNPSKSHISIESSGLIESVKIYDLNGQSLLHLENINENIVSFAPDTLLQGVYLIHIVSADGNFIMRKIQLIR